MRSSASQHAFLLGSARSGTSFVAHSLAQHAEIALSEPKEPHFMAFVGTDLNFAGPGDDESINLYSVTDPDLYERAFADGARVAFDASVTSLYYHAPAIANLRKYCKSEPILFVVLRDPLDRAFSSFMYQRSKGYEPLESFEEALHAEEERKSRNWQHMFHYKGVSDYAPGLRAFRDAFGSEAVHVSFYERISEAPLAGLNGILTHLGLENFDTLPIDHVVNSSGAPRIKALTAAQQWLRGHPGLRLSLRKAVPIRYREKLRRANQRREATYDGERLRNEPAWAGIYERIREEIGTVPDAWK